METVTLISCGKSKRDELARARDMYTSNLFRLSRAYAEATGDVWWIVSAKHGLLRPDWYIQPYELSMRELRRCRCDLSKWITMLSFQAASWLPHEYNITLLGGSQYAKAIKRALPDVEIIEPLKGLQLGYRMQWLKANTRSRTQCQPEATAT